METSPPPPPPAPLPPFLTKTFDMVDDSLTNPIVSWSPTRPDGFVVWKIYEFSSSLLPQFYKHNNFSSFVRQLNTYGFRKADPERWEFAHDEFRKGQRHRLRNIHRKRPTSSRSLRAVSLAVQPFAQEGPLLSQARKRAGVRSTSCGVESDFVQLTSERNAMFLELSGLKTKYQAAHRCVKHISDQLEMLEARQQQIVAFAARTLCAPNLFYKSVDRAIAADRNLALQEHTECNGYTLNSLDGEAKRKRLSVCTAQCGNGRKLSLSHGQTALEMNPSNGKWYADAQKLKQQIAAWKATESEEFRETAAGLDNKLMREMGLQKVNADPCIVLHSLEARDSSSGVLGRENVARNHDAGFLSSACNALLRTNNYVNLPLFKGPKLEEDEDLQTTGFDVQGFTWKDSPFSFAATQDAFEDMLIDSPLPFVGSQDAIEDLLLFNNVQQATLVERLAPHGEE